MATVKVVPRSLTDAYKRREGDFAPNLVGLQFTDGVSLFTFGNFQITTNLDRKINKNFVLGGEWSGYYSLDNLSLTQTQSTNLSSTDLSISLNFDINNISRYVYFGSFYEYTRVTIEQIIQKWKGSLYLNPTVTNTPGNTVLNFNYDSGMNISTFLMPESLIQNPYQLITEDNIDFNSLQPEDIFNLSRDYKNYVILNGNNQYKVIGYTGSTTGNPYLRVQTQGNAFPSLTATTFGQIIYHMRPNDTEVDLFFNVLEDFEKIILNRLTVPIYTSSFDVPSEADGFIVFSQKRFTWPITDGYNLDISGRDYGRFLEGILNMATIFDTYKTDLVSRRFVAESIHEFDTDGGGDEIYGKKVGKLLKIYGREFDQVKKYIDGISFANVVTYNKLDNTSDDLIKIMAKNLGLDVLLSVTTDNFNLLEQIQPSYQTPFSGYSRSLSAKELDVELWRRLVINAWWLFKSKGSRKVIEFFLKFFNVPECLVSLDEYVYLAANRLDTTKVFNQLEAIINSSDNLVNNGDVSLLNYPIDTYGFPKIPIETNDNYFQMDGFWYNGGNESTIGNNPHFGEYDYGKHYFQQFECFVPNFDSLLTGSTLVDVSKNYFNNYNKGTFMFDQNGLPVPYYGTTYANTLNGGLVQNAVVNTAGLINTGGLNSPKYGRPSGDTFSMKLNFTTGTKLACSACPFELTFGPDGIVYIKGGSSLQNESCCPNYWLPIPTTPAPSCPRPTELAITSPDHPLGPCVILNTNTGQSVLQSCCNKTTLGFDVTWNGTSCVDTNCSTSVVCPGPTQLSLTSDLSIYGGCVYLDTTTGLPLSQVCCTDRTMYWDGQYCKDTGCLPPIDPNLLTSKTVISSGEIFGIDPNGGNVPVNPVGPTNYCYWCPPSPYIKKYCSVDGYLADLTIQGIEALAIIYGWIPPTNNEVGISPSLYLTIILGDFFTKYACIYVDNLNNAISNEACCTLRGGTWVDTNTVDSGTSNYKCVDPIANQCGSGTVINTSNVVVYGDDSLASQDCCLSLGYQWTNGVISTYENNISTGSIIDSTGLSYANTFNTNSYCSPCPSSINIIEECDTNSNCTFVVKDNNTNTNLSQSCCVGYGYTYDSTTSRCLTCPTVVNYEPKSPFKITNLDNSDLTVICCNNIGGWYGNALGDGDKCYQCPGILIYDDLGNSTANPNYTVIDGEILYGGDSLTPTCCENYATVIGTGTWDAALGKCVIV